MNQLVYLIAFGPECLEQFKVCYKGLKLCEVDVALITDQNYNEEKVSVIRVDPVTEAKEQYIFRTNFQDYIDIGPYDRVWYMDCDFLVFEDVFKRYEDSSSILLSNEPRWTMGNDCFGSALTHDERVKYYHLPAINGGIYSVPKRYYKFFEEYRLKVIDFKDEHPEVNIPEQMVLNSMYARQRENYDFKLIEVGYPEKGVIGTEPLYHYACYKFGDKLKLMQWESQTR